MKSKFLFVILFISSLTISACSKGVVAETELTTPESLGITSTTFDVYGDDIVFTVSGTEAIQSVTDTQLVVLPNRTEFDTVTVDYIQGNSLNNFPEAYYNGLSDKTTSALVNDKFTTADECYGFLTTSKNNYLLFKGPIDKVDYLSALMERFVE